MKKEPSFNQIGQAAKESGCSIDTIRYYEKEGLLKAPARTEGGFRKYPREAIERIRFIKKAQSFGFTLSEIKTIMCESEKGLESCCNHVGKVLNRKLAELETKIKELQTTRKQLRSLVESWIPLRKARKESFVVCPQIETERPREIGGKQNGKKKSDGMLKLVETRC